MDKAVIAKYIRLSQDEAYTDSLSIENQRLILEQYLMDSDLDGAEVLEFVDNGFTGTNFERPAVQEMLELVRAGKIQCILVKDFSRFGRDALETGYFIERVFPLFRVRFIAVSDGFDSFAGGGNVGGMEVSFKFLINEYYSKDLSVKIRSVKRQKALRGEAVTKNCAFGYVLDDGRNMVVDPEAAQTVRIIFEMYAVKKSLTDIERRLYEERRLSPSAHKSRRRGENVEDGFQYVWKKSMLLVILRDEQYLGTYIAGKRTVTEVGGSRQRVNDAEDWIRFPGHHPAIVSQALFNAAQAQLLAKGEPLRKRKLDTTKRYAKQRESALIGKVVCGHCGHTMIISSTKNAAFHCHFTRAISDAACHGVRVLKNELEAVVLESIKRQAKIVSKAGLRADDVQALYMPAAAEHMGKIETMRAEKHRLYESLVLGNIEREAYKAQKAALDAELNGALRVHAAVLAECRKNLPDEESLQAAKQALRAKKLSGALADLLVDKVLVYPGDKIEVVWKLEGFLKGFAQEAQFFVAP